MPFLYFILKMRTYRFMVILYLILILYFLCKQFSGSFGNSTISKNNSRKSTINLKYIEETFYTVHGYFADEIIKFIVFNMIDLDKFDLVYNYRLYLNKDKQYTISFSHVPENHYNDYRQSNFKRIEAIIPDNLINGNQIQALKNYTEAKNLPSLIYNPPDYNLISPVMNKKGIFRNEFETFYLRPEFIWILPRFYSPLVENSPEKSKYCLFPNYQEYRQIKDRHDFVIDVLSKNWSQIINQMLFHCQYIISSDIYGIILSDVYKIPNLYLNVSPFSNQKIAESYFEKRGKSSGVEGGIISDWKTIENWRFSDELFFYPEEHDFIQVQEIEEEFPFQ